MPHKSMALAILACFSTLLCAGCSAGGGLNGRDVILYQDPSGGEPYPVFDGRVEVSVKAPSGAPWSDHNFFDGTRTEAELDEYYGWAYGGYRSSPELQAFLAAEYLEVAEWWDISGLTVLLPEGVGVAEAVQSWPAEYPDVVQSAWPLVVEEGDGYYGLD